MAETKKSAITRNPVISRVSELDICSVRSQEGTSRSAVLKTIIKQTPRGICYQGSLLSRRGAFLITAAALRPARHCRRRQSNFWTTGLHFCLFSVLYLCWQYTASWIRFCGRQARWRLHCRMHTVILRGI